MTNTPRANSSVSVMYIPITSSLEEQPSTAWVSLGGYYITTATRIEHLFVFSEKLAISRHINSAYFAVNNLPYLIGQILASITSPASILDRAATLFSALTIAPRQI